MSEPELQGKSYDIPKRLVWDAWLKVRSNRGAAGADGVTIEQCSRFGCARGRSLRRGSTLAGSQPLLPSPEPE